MSTPGSGAEPTRDPSDPYADLRGRQPEQTGYPAFSAPADDQATPQQSSSAHPADHAAPQQPFPPVPPAPGYAGPDSHHGPQPQYAPWGAPAAGSRPVSERPGTVIAAAIMVWVGATLPAVLGMIALFGGGIATWVLSSAGFPGEAGLAPAAITAIFIGIAAVFLLWATLMVWAGIAAFRGRNWGRWLLAVQGGLYLLVVGGLRMLALDPSVIIDLAYVGGCLTLLFLPPSSRWYAHLRSPGGSHAPSPPKG